MTSQTTDGVIVVFGESENDRKSIAMLVRALCPKARTKVMRSPLVLIKDASASEAPSRAERVVAVAKAIQSRETIKCIFAHEDADAVEPEHVRVAERIERTLEKADAPCKVHAVVPAWEIEAWWFLWPEIVASCYKRWSEPKLGTPPGRIENAKERLADAVKPARLTPAQRKKFPDYRESDSITIARAIQANDKAHTPPFGRSLSYDRFRASVADCCS